MNALNELRTRLTQSILSCVNSARLHRLAPPAPSGFALVAVMGASSSLLMFGMFLHTLSLLYLPGGGFRVVRCLACLALAACSVIEFGFFLFGCARVLERLFPITLLPVKMTGKQEVPASVSACIEVADEQRQIAFGYIQKAIEELVKDGSELKLTAIGARTERLRRPIESDDGVVDAMTNMIYALASGPAAYLFDQAIAEGECPVCLLSRLLLGAARSDG